MGFVFGGSAIHFNLGMLAIALFALHGLCAYGEAGPSASERQSDQAAAFDSWIGENAIHIDTLDWQLFDTQKLSKLDAALDGKRVVFLGEPDHFIREKFDYRMIMIRYLASRGWRNIGMEMGRSDAKRLDEYLASGDASLLDRVGIYGYDGDLRTDRDDTIEGWTDNKHPEVSRRVSADCKWFMRQLRSLSESIPHKNGRLRWFGFDVSFKPGGAYADVRQMLALHSHDPIIAEVITALARVNGESRHEESIRLRRLLWFIEENEGEILRSLGPESARELPRAINCLADGLDLVDALKLPRGSHLRRQALKRREQTMVRQLDEIIAELPADEKIILLGHNLHLSKDSERAWWGDQKMWVSIGTHVHRKMPGEVFAIWMLFDRGKHFNIHTSPVLEEVHSLPGSLESILARTGGEYLILFPPQGQQPLLTIEQRMMTVVRAIPCKQTDAIFFVEKVREPGGR